MQAYTQSTFSLSIYDAQDAPLQEVLLILKDKNEKVTQQTVHDFIDTLDVEDAMKTRLKEITPSNYTGVKLV